MEGVISMFLNDIGCIKTTKLNIAANSPIVLASERVLANQRVGRTAIEVSNTSDQPIYLGDKDVNVENGLPIKAGDSKILPVLSLSTDNIYVTAAADVSVILAEYFD